MEVTTTAVEDAPSITTASHSSGEDAGADTGMAADGSLKDKKPVKEIMQKMTGEHNGKGVKPCDDSSNMLVEQLRSLLGVNVCMSGDSSNTSLLKKSSQRSRSSIQSSNCGESSRSTDSNKKPFLLGVAQKLFSCNTSPQDAPEERKSKSPEEGSNRKGRCAGTEIDMDRGTHPEPPLQAL